MLRRACINFRLLSARLGVLDGPTHDGTKDEVRITDGGLAGYTRRERANAQSKFNSMGFVMILLAYVLHIIGRACAIFDARASTVSVARAECRHKQARDESAQKSDENDGEP